MKNGRLERGDYIRLRKNKGDDWAEGFVALAGGTSVLVMSNDLARASGGMLTGAIPLTVNYEAGKVTGLIGGDEYEVEVKDAH